MASLDEIHRSAENVHRNGGYVVSSTESTDAETFVGTPRTLTPAKSKKSSNFVHKSILALFTLAVISLVAISLVTFVLVLGQNEDIRIIRDDIRKIHQQRRVALFPENVKQHAVGLSRGLTSEEPTSVQRHPESTTGTILGTSKATFVLQQPSDSTTFHTPTNATSIDDDIVMGWYKASNGLRYKFVGEISTYEKARSECNKRGARLASTGLRSETIRNELYKLSPNLEFWVGMDDVKSKGRWEWSDGIESPENELPWDEGQPNHAKIATITQECVEMVYFGKFNDEYCTLPQNFLCERA